MPAPTEPRAAAAIANVIANVIALALALVMLTAKFAQAETPHWPDATDIEQALKAHPFPGADRLAAQPVPPPPRLSPSPAPTDIAAMAESGARIGSGAAPTATASPVRIFITLAMPRASLQLLIDQAARSGAVLVLRGLKANSLRETLAAVSGLIGERQVAWVIDPEAFTRYRVEHAPTFVLTLTGPSGHDAPGTSCGTDCPTSAAFASVSGDVSLDYALETLLRHRPDAAALVTPILKRLRGS